MVELDPVVVNVLYKNNCWEHIIISSNSVQIDVLNKDFNAVQIQNFNVPSGFFWVKANVGITFCSLDAVTRKSTTKVSWKTDDSMKKAVEVELQLTNQPQN
jgi:hypothetical protein